MLPLANAGMYTDAPCISTISTSRPYLANKPSRLAIHPGQNVAAGDAYATTSLVICPLALSQSAMNTSKLKPKIILFIVIAHLIRADRELKSLARMLSSVARLHISVVLKQLCVARFKR